MSEGEASPIEMAVAIFIILGVLPMGWIAFIRWCNRIQP